MSFVEGIVCPQASQTCCDTPPSFGKDTPGLNFLFCLRGGDGGGEALGGRKYILLCLSLEWNVSSSVVVYDVSQLLKALTFTGASILRRVLTGPVIVGYSCHNWSPQCCLRLPSLPR